MKLIKLKIKDWKGIDEKVIEFNGKDTAILGTNEAGKTTIADAYRWLLFDKNSNGDSQFGINPFDENNNTIHHLNSIVEGIFEVDGMETVFKKDYHEVWTKKRGTSEQEFSGHTTDYYIDDVPIKKKEYEKEIAKIIDEEIFKLVTDPLYFNEQLRWKEQKEILYNLIDKPEPEEIATEAETFYLIENMGNRDIKAHKKMIKSKLKKINEELEDIQPRIDEVSRNIGQVDHNKSDLQNKLEVKKNKRNKLQEKIANLKANQNTEVREEFIETKEKYNTIKNKLMDKANELLDEIRDNIYIKKTSIDKMKSNIKNYQTKIENNKKELESISNFLENLSNNRKEWEEKEFKKEQSVCPACGQELPKDQIEKHREEFNTQKSKKLEELDEEKEKAINKRKEIKKDNNKYQSKINEWKEKIEKLNKEVVKLKARKNKGEKYKENINKGDVDKLKGFKGKLTKLKEKLDNDGVDDSKIKESKNKINNINDEIADIEKKISKVESIEKAKERIEELQEKEKKYRQQYEKFEKELYDIEKYIKTKADMVEDDINSLFEITEFKLFDRQVNGGIKETCEALKNGVPYSDMNTGSKYQVGMDIINVLSNHYNFYAPVFIDNRERIAKIPEINSQTVHLIMTPKYKEMEVIHLEDKSADEIVEEEGGFDFEGETLF